MLIKLYCNHIKREQIKQKHKPKNEKEIKFDVRTVFCVSEFLWISLESVVSAIAIGSFFYHRKNQKTKLQKSATWMIITIGLHKSTNNIITNRETTRNNRIVRVSARESIYTIAPDDSTIGTYICFVFLLFLFYFHLRIKWITVPHLIVP